MRRATVTRGVAALGAACLLLAPFAVSARADEAPLPVYQSTGIGQGVIVTFATVPSIFNPLIQVGSNYTASTINSQGGGQSSSVAAQVYPGTLATGALGCGGSLPAQFLPFTNEMFVKASFPKAQGCSTEAHNTIVSLPSNGSGMSLKTGDLSVTTSATQSTSSATTQGLSMGAPAMPPVLSIGSMSVNGASKAVGKTVQNLVNATAKNVSLAGGAVTIGSIISTSSAASDGTTGNADGTLTFADVNVLLGGQHYAARIDNFGIHVSQPGLSRDQNLGLTEQLTDVLVHAGIKLSAASPTKIIDGASGESSIGGLVVSIDLTAPPVTIPPELAPVFGQVINQIPTKCLSEFGIPAPICFGPGIIPGPGSEGRLTFNIASTDAFAVGGLTLGGPSIGGGPIGGGITPPIGAPSIGAVGPGPSPQPLTQPTTAPATGPLRLFGLVARLPAAALLWAGLALLILAMGFAYGPSLRHVRER